MRPETQAVRVAVVQAAPVLFDIPRTLQKLADLAADAARKGAELVVFQRLSTVAVSPRHLSRPTCRYVAC
ncbi:MAG: hypothetical protein K8U57_30310 [Planctomycetes bacterium]|nr:hypothetical protein [Planctomycetota bacterium]